MKSKKYVLSLTNLQPLCSKENIVNKNSKFDPKTFRYKWIDRETGWVGIPKYLMAQAGGDYARMRSISLSNNL